jgi:hypothetical protein
MKPELIELYAAGGKLLRSAIAGLTREDLTAFPVPGTWSIQQIVLHLMDSDLITADRMKRIIAEENPTLIGFDESSFARELFYHDQSIEDAATIFDLNRRMFSVVLRKLPASAFAREGTHNERGPLTLAQLVEGMVKHMDHHLKFLYEKRNKLGKPLR